MSMFFCNECGNLSDADDGCAETPNGMNLICTRCMDELLCEHCDQYAVTELDGEQLCQAHADQWCRNEGHAEYAAEQDQTS